MNKKCNIWPLFAGVAIFFAACKGEEESDPRQNNIPVYQTAFTSCDEDSYYEDLESGLVNRITRLETHADTLLMDIKFEENCCIGFDPRFRFERDTLRISLYDPESIEELCLCMCCYGISASLGGIENPAALTVMIGNEVMAREPSTYPLK
jgi:hypothetical protein